MDTILVALFSLVGTIAGSLFGVIASNKLVNFRLEELEKKLESYDDILVRIVTLEQKFKNFQYNNTATK